MSDRPGGARILVVDDDTGVLRAVERVLGREHNVRATNEPTEGARLAAEFQPDLAICDIQMPQLDGFQLLEDLRQSCPGLDVILMTGSLTDQDAHLIRSLEERVYYFILKPFEREVLLTLVDRCLETRRLRQRELQHLHRIEQELEAARAFQQAMFPPPHRELCGVRVDARCEPCGEVGGDLFDSIERDGQLAFLIADVRGHGVPAALLTGTVKTVFRAGINRGETAEQVAAGLVQSLAAFSEDRFVTAILGILDPQTGRLEYVNAGHPPAFVLEDASDPQPLDSTAPLLSSIFPAGSWSGAAITLSPGARLLLYTDGLRDAAGDGVAYPIERILGCVRSAKGGEDAVAKLMSDLDEFRDARPLVDDVTVMLLELPVARDAPID